MTSPIVVAALLRVLALGKGFKTPRETLFVHANLKLRPARTEEQLLQSLQFAEGKGWVASDQDDYGQPRHWLTEGGEIKAAELG